MRSFIFRQSIPARWLKSTFQTTSVPFIQRSNLTRLQGIIKQYESNPTQDVANALAHEAMSEHHRDLMSRSIESKFGTSYTDLKSLSPNHDLQEAVENNLYLALSRLAKIDRAYFFMSPTKKSNDIHYAEELLPGGIAVQKICKEFDLTLPNAGDISLHFNFQWTGQRTTIDMGLNACHLSCTLTLPENLRNNQILDTLSQEHQNQINSMAGQTIELFDRHEEDDSDRQSSISPSSQALILAIQELMVSQSTELFPLADLTMRQFSWWLSFFCAHPSNWAFDRTTIEFDF